MSPLAQATNSARAIPIQERLPRLLAALGEGLYERQDALRLGLLAALSGESVFLLGPPGIAKSLIARRLKLAFFEARHFEYLMTRFSTPEEVFGPLSIQALKEDGKYLRLTAGYLPEAEVVFLDEIWKAGPAILNTLLTAINERQFRNGDSQHPIPMRLLVTASNELPAPDSGLEALYDRMLVRIWMDRVQEKSNFQAMLASDGHSHHNLPASLQIRGDEYEQWQGEIEQVRLPDACFELIYQLRQQLDSQLAYRCYVSDRRWKKAVRLIKASAFFNGRDEVAPLDLLLFKDCLWHDEESRTALLEMMTEFSRLYGYQQLAMTRQLLALRDQFKQLKQSVAQRLCCKARQRKQWFGRRARGIEIPLANARPFGKQVHFHLLTPAPLDGSDPERLTDTLMFDRTLLSHWRPTGEALVGHPLGNPKEGHYELVLDDELRLQVLDIQRQQVPLVLVERSAIPEVVLEPWLQALDELQSQTGKVQQDLKQQRSLFERHQQHLFIASRWLQQVEDSFFVLGRDLELLRSELAQWRERLPRLDG
ncbi:ATPase RavA domain-containing protein [Aeromonas jandaei]|uniref:ATPase RavA domain-containing protein n=1 Tax=Aeromonas jandaei TaxID=650 RepID=UPI001115EA0A|nr:ATPase RavA domain-containing protein [Aeromonas jandaei]TNH98868.1 ATPase RavA [Aeromonas jandaei]